MLASSHQVASSSSLSVSFLIMFLAAARVHWGGPPWVPVLLALPAIFLSGLRGFGLWFVFCVVVVGFLVGCPFPGVFGWVMCACCSGIGLYRGGVCEVSLFSFVLFSVYLFEFVCDWFWLLSSSPSSVSSVSDSLD
jgi:hypothetical protein